MVEKRYYNFSKEVREKLLPKWRAYRQFFGLETEIIKTLEREGKSKEQIEDVLNKRKEDVANLWPEIKSEY